MPSLPPIPGFCPHCESYNELTAHFCGQCGKALPVAAEDGGHSEALDPEILEDSVDFASEDVTTETFADRGGVDAPGRGEATGTETGLADFPDLPEPGTGTNLWQKLEQIPTIESDNYEAPQLGAEEDTVTVPGVAEALEITGDTQSPQGPKLVTTAKMSQALEGGPLDSNAAFSLSDSTLDEGAPVSAVTGGTPGVGQSPAPTGRPGGHQAQQPVTVRPTPPAEPADGELQMQLPSEAAAPDGEILEPPAAPWLAIPRNGVEFDAFSLDDSPHLVGKSPTCDLPLQDELASRFHVLVQVLGDRHFVIDVKSRRGTLVNGEPIMQTALRHGDVLRIGNTFLVYVGKELHRTARVPLRPLLPNAAISLDDRSQLEVRTGNRPKLSFIDGKQVAFSSSDAQALVGTHPACKWKVVDPGVAPFHAQLAWINGEPQFWDLYSGMGTFVNREVVQRATLRHGDIVQLGRRTFAVHISGGDAFGSPTAERATAALARSLCITCIRGADRGGTHTLKADDNVLIMGRDSTSDLRLQDDAVAGNHAALTFDRGKLHLDDLTGQKLTVINGVRSQEGKLVPGQLFKVGHDVFLVHYDRSMTIYR